MSTSRRISRENGSAVRVAAAVKRRRATAPVLKGLAGAAIAAALAAPAGAAEIVFQAEGGTTLSGMDILASDRGATPAPDGPVITTAANNTTLPPSGSLPPNYASYDLNFTEPGDYTLYARVMAFGPGGGANAQGNNDSLFVPRTFGATPDFSVSNEYGNTTPNENVAFTSGAGDNRQTVYHWVNTRTGQGLEHGGSISSGNRTPAYTVGAPGPHTFVLGGREDGFRMDAFVFSNQNLGASQLDSLVGIAPVAFNIPADAPRGGLGTMGIREIREGTGGGVGDQTQANVKLNAPPADAFRADYQAPVLNLYDSGTQGRFGNNQLFRTDPDQADPGNDTVNNIVVLAQGTVRVPAGQGGVHTFGVNSDDGFTLLFPGKDFNGTTIVNGSTINTTQGRALQFWGGRGVNDTLGQITLPEGDHDFILQYHEGGGGASVELFSARGAHTTGPAANLNFNLVGAPAEAFPARPSKVNTVGPWDVRVFDGADNLAEVVDNGRLGTETGVTLRTRANVQAINFTDPQNPNVGSHGSDALPFPGDTAADENSFGAYATTSLTIAAADAGPHTFLMYSDDNSQFRILASNGDAVELTGVAGGATSGNNMIDQADSADDADLDNDTFGDFNGCCNDYLGQYSLAEGTYTIEAAFREGGGGSGFFIYGAEGTHTAFNTTDFELLGGFPGSPGRPEGLQLVPEPGTFGLAGVAALGLLARRRRPRQA